MEKASEATKRGVGRPSKAQPFRQFVVDLLLREPNLRSLEIVKRARAAGYLGGKSALYSLIASVRPRRSRPLSNRDRIPGEIVRHGFGQVDVKLRDGAERTVNFFLSRLEYSQWVAVSLVPDQSVESCARSMVAHYQSMGGTPLLAAFDRARPIAVDTNDDGLVTEWDSAFAYVALQLGIGVDVRARRGAERGPGTNLGNWLRTVLIKTNEFVDEADLVRQVTAAVNEHNETPQAETGGKSPAILLTEERQRLRPLRVDPRDLALRFPVLVGQQRSIVLHDGHAYPMPPEAAGLLGVLRLFPDRVEIVAGRYQATHPRLRAARNDMAAPHAGPSRPVPQSTIGWSPATAGAPAAAAATGGGPVAPLYRVV